MHIFETLGYVYLVILVLRAVFSWFPPPASGSPFSTVRSILWRITEPVLAPFRRLIPPVGGFDLSFTVAFLVLLVIIRLVLVRLP